MINKEISESASRRVFNQESNFTGILAKYISVWIWSILFAANSGLLYSFLNLRSYEKWGYLVLLPLILTSSSIFCSLYSWFYLYKYLKDSILPNFFIKYNNDIEIHDSDKKSILIALYIRKSFLFLMAGTMLKLMASLSELFLSSGFSSGLGF